MPRRSLPEPRQERLNARKWFAIVPPLTVWCQAGELAQLELEERADVALSQPAHILDAPQQLRQADCVAPVLAHQRQGAVPAAGQQLRV
jgi:hypothetical protein